MAGKGIFVRQGMARKAAGSPFASAKVKRDAKPRPAPKPVDDIALPAGPRVIVEYPPAILSPNARVHWSKRSRAARVYRKACWALALQAKIVAPREGAIRLRLDFFPPAGPAPDDDNVIAAFKAGRDGIADALKVDDGRFQIVPVMHRERRSCVVVTLIEAEAA